MLCSQRSGYFWLPVRKCELCAVLFARPLTHWGRVAHMCVSKLTIIGSENGLSPGRRQVIIWTNAGILLIRPLGTNFSEILIGIQTFSLTKMHSKCRLQNGVHFVSASILLNHKYFTGGFGLLTPKVKSFNSTKRVSVATHNPLPSDPKSPNRCQ